MPKIFKNFEGVGVAEPEVEAPTLEGGADMLGKEMTYSGVGGVRGGPGVTGLKPMGVSGGVGAVTSTLSIGADGRSRKARRSRPG